MLTSHHQLGRIAPKNSSLTLVEQTTLGYLGKLLKSNADKTQVRQTSHDSKNIRMHRLNQAERAINAFKNSFYEACNTALSLLVSMSVLRFHTKPTSNHVKPCRTSEKSIITPNAYHKLEPTTSASTLIAKSLFVFKKALRKSSTSKNVDNSDITSAILSHEVAKRLSF